MRVLIFGGTTEGRNRAAAQMQAGDEVEVCVVSEYARQLLPRGMRVHVGRLDVAGMEARIRTFQAEKVVDATHPFAAEASENIRAACARMQIPLERVSRDPDEGSWRESVRMAKDTDEAISLLRETEGRILLTTGTRTLAKYRQALPEERLYVRVLPTEEALAACRGLPGSRILAMQGPFSEELNDALYVLWQISVLVTKDSGKPGGVREKVLPALRRGMTVILIGRPKEAER